MLIHNAIKISYCQIVCTLAFVLICLSARADERVWGTVSAEPVRAVEVDELTTSIQQLRQQVDSADAASAAQLLQQWAAQNSTKIDAAKVQLAAVRESLLASSQGKSVSDAGIAERNLTSEEQEFVTLRRRLAVTQQAALSNIPVDDAKARRDALAHWRFQHKDDLARTELVEEQDSYRDRANNLALRAQRLQAEVALSRQDLSAKYPGLSPPQYQLLALRNQLDYRKVVFDQSHLSAGPKAYRDAYASFKFENRSLYFQITTLEQLAAENLPDTATANPLSAAEVSELSPADRLSYEALQLWEQGRKRLREEHPQANQKEMRDLLARYDAQTHDLQQLFR